MQQKLTRGAESASVLVRYSNQHDPVPKQDVVADMLFKGTDLTIQ